MDRGLTGFVVVFVVLALMGVILGNLETIKPAVAQAEMSNATGPGVALAINKGLALFLKLALGGVVSGIALFVFNELKTAYRLWKKDQRTRRWKPGPNAQWKPPQQPRLTKNDLMFMSLLGRGAPNPQNIRLDQRQMPRQDESDLDIDLS